MYTEVDIPRMLHTPAIVRVAWPTMVLGLTDYTQPRLSNSTTEKALPQGTVSTMPAFVAEDRAALRAGRPLDRPEEMRELAKRVLEEQGRMGRPADITAWAERLASDAAELKD